MLGLQKRDSGSPACSPDPSFYYNWVCRRPGLSWVCRISKKTRTIFLKIYFKSLLLQKGTLVFFKAK